MKIAHNLYIILFSYLTVIRYFVLSLFAACIDEIQPSNFRQLLLGGESESVFYCCCVLRGLSTFCSWRQGTATRPVSMVKFDQQVIH